MIRLVLKRVEAQLRSDPDLINSDKKLELAVWASEGLLLDPAQRAIFLNECSPAPSIARARQRLQPRFLKHLLPEIAAERAKRHNAMTIQMSPRVNETPGKRRSWKHVFKLRRLEHHG